MQQVILIYTMFGDSKHYISGHSTRFDNKVLPQISSDENKARYYRSQSYAELIISRIHNIYNRKWETETINVPKESVAKFGSVILKNPQACISF